MNVFKEMILDYFGISTILRSGLKQWGIVDNARI